MNDKGNPNDIGAVMTDNGWVVTGKGTTSFIDGPHIMYLGQFPSGGSLAPSFGAGGSLAGMDLLESAKRGVPVTLSNDPITVKVGDPAGYRRDDAKDA